MVKEEILGRFFIPVKAGLKKRIANIKYMLEHTNVENTVGRENLERLQRVLLRKNIEDFAKKIGFDLVGFSPAKIEDKYLKPFEDWLNKGQNGTMKYMKKIEQRCDLTKILPGAKSVIVLAVNYYNEQSPLRKNHGRIARYAYGRDYHKVIKKMLKKVEEYITHSGASLVSATGAPTTTNPATAISGSPTPFTRSYVDTGPILERALAQQAGLGRIGKNTCLITKEYGSWVFLAEIITTLDLTEKVAPGQLFGQKMASGSQTDRWSNPQAQNFNVCGNCTSCITACPTGAIIAPGVMDARLCISYLTIENKNRIPPQLAKIIKKTKRLYGCDICQEVCPHNNARQKDINKNNIQQTPHTLNISPDYALATAPSLITSSPLSSVNNSKIAGDQLSLKTLTKPRGPLNSDQHFLKTFAGSALMRAKRKGLQRNAKVLQ